MQAVDSAFANAGIKPPQRPILLGRMFWEGLGWGGSIFPPKELANQPGFTGDVLMAKAQRWYEEAYDERLHVDSSNGHAPVRLGNATWKATASRVYGQVRLFLDRNLQNKGIQVGTAQVEASYNVLCAVDGLTQKLANRLSELALVEYFDFYLRLHRVLQWRHELPNVKLFNIARADFEESTMAVMTHKYEQACWGAEQAIEKTLKGLLQLAGAEYPSGGSKAHNLLHLGGLLEIQNIVVSPDMLRRASYSAGVRYGKEELSEDDALLANHAVLAVLDELRVSRRATELAANAKQVNS